MIRRITCIECPKGCSLSVKVRDGIAAAVSGGMCLRGASYATQEVENPQRILTAGVLARGLPFAIVPVKTDKPIPRAALLKAMAKIKKLRIRKSVHIGDVVVRNFLGLGVNLVVTREFFI